tara:strand:+ start:633 stop:1031 length:399 start_codon:yes stop_codon:yes gene_type:complete
MEKAVLITTQNVENYNLEGGNHWKYKGGSDYIVSFEVEKLIFEEDAYGEGDHSYYLAPKCSEATIVALVNQLGNAGSLGYQSYVKSVESVEVTHVTEDEEYYKKDNEALELFKAKRMTWQELEEQVKECKYG